MHPIVWLLIATAGFMMIIMVGVVIVNWTDNREQRRNSEHKKAVLYKKTLLEIEDLVQNNITITGHARMDEDMILEKVRRVVRQIE